MARTFVITPAGDTLPLVGGAGQIVYTVSNTVGSPVRGRAKLTALGGTKQEWLTLTGESERDFSSAGTHQFTVSFAAPTGTPAGKYPFRLDMVSVVNPDEDFSEGPSVTAEVAATAAEPAKSSFPMWIIPLILGILLVGGLVTWLALRDGDEPSNSNEVANANTNANVEPTASPGPTNSNQGGIPRPTIHFSPRPVTPTPTPVPTPPPPPLQVQSVALTANPTNYTGKCPRIIEFTATIKANRGGVVNYQIKKKDGTVFPTQSVTVNPNGTVNVSWSRAYGKESSTIFDTNRYNEWEMLVVQSPNARQSNAAIITGNCRSF